ILNDDEKLVLVSELGRLLQLERRSLSANDPVQATRLHKERKDLASRLSQEEDKVDHDHDVDVDVDDDDDVTMSGRGGAPLFWQDPEDVRRREEMDRERERQSRKSAKTGKTMRKRE
ncbi:hypothetical protein HKX48_002276, partial [Thoreauomyces humboldtii]